MPALRARRIFEAPVQPNRPALRLATVDDLASPSEVASLQRLIDLEFNSAQEPARLAGFISIPLVLGASAALWWGLYLAVRALAHF